MIMSVYCVFRALWKLCGNKELIYRGKTTKMKTTICPWQKINNTSTGSEYESEETVKQSTDVSGKILCGQDLVSGNAQSREWRICTSEIPLGSLEGYQFRVEWYPIIRRILKPLPRKSCMTYDTSNFPHSTQHAFSVTV